MLRTNHDGAMLQSSVVSASPAQVAAEARIGVALRQAAYALDDADRVLRSIRHYNTWNSRGMRALNEELAFEQVSLAGLRVALSEFRGG